MKIDYRSVKFIKTFVLFNRDFSNTTNQVVSLILSEALKEMKIGLGLKQNPIIFLTSNGTDALYVIILFFNDYGFLKERRNFLVVDEEKFFNFIKIF